MRYKRLISINNKGFVLPLVLVVLLALTSFSVAMLAVIKSGALKAVKSHQVNTVSQAAEFGLEAGRLWLVDQITQGGTSPIVITNTKKSEINGDCLGLHGYTKTAEKIWYNYRKQDQNLTSITNTDYGRYSYEFYVQRIGHQTTLDGYNYIPQTTQGSDSLTVNTYNDRRIFYRVLSCGYGPNLKKIVPLQLYLSSGGDGTSGNIARAINIEGYYRPWTCTALINESILGPILFLIALFEIRETSLANLGPFKSL